MKKINQDSNVTETKKKILTLTNASRTSKIAYEFNTTTGIVVMASATENMMNLYVRELVKKPIKVEKFLESVNRCFRQNVPPSRESYLEKCQKAESRDPCRATSAQDEKC